MGRLRRDRINAELQPRCGCCLVLVADGRCWGLSGVATEPTEVGTPTRLAEAAGGFESLWQGSR